MRRSGTSAPRVQSQNRPASGSIEPSWLRRSRSMTRPRANTTILRHAYLRLRLVPWDVTAHLLSAAGATRRARLRDELVFAGFSAFSKTSARAAIARRRRSESTTTSIRWCGVESAPPSPRLLLGPLVSLLKGWYLSFWPLLAIAHRAVRVGGRHGADRVQQPVLAHADASAVGRDAAPSESEITTRARREFERPQLRISDHRSVTVRQKISPGAPARWLYDGICCHSVGSDCCEFNGSPAGPRPHGG